eukprot:Rmarinus@m.19944
MKIFVSAGFALAALSSVCVEAALSSAVTFCAPYITYDYDPIVEGESGSYVTDHGENSPYQLSGQRYDEWADSYLQNEYNIVVAQLEAQLGVGNVCDECLEAWKEAACRNFFPYNGFSACLEQYCPTICNSDYDVPSCGCGCMACAECYDDATGGSLEGCSCSTSADANQVPYYQCQGVEPIPNDDDGDAQGCDMDSCDDLVDTCAIDARMFIVDCDLDAVSTCYDYLTGSGICEQFYQACGCNEIIPEWISRACGHLPEGRSDSDVIDTTACSNMPGWCSYSDAPTSAPSTTAPARRPLTVDEPLNCVYVGDEADDLCLTFPGQTLLMYPRDIAGARDVPSASLKQVRDVPAMMPDPDTHDQVMWNDDDLVVSRSSFSVTPVTNVETPVYVPNSPSAASHLTYGIIAFVLPLLAALAF